MDLDCFSLFAMWVHIKCGKNGLTDIKCIVKQKADISMFCGLITLVMILAIFSLQICVKRNMVC